MAIISLTKFKDPYYTYTTNLAGQSVKVTFIYNDYDGGWYLTLADSEGSIIRAGIKLKCGGFFLLGGLSESAYMYIYNKGTSRDLGIKSYNNFEVLVGWED